MTDARHSSRKTVVLGGLCLVVLAAGCTDHGNHGAAAPARPHVSPSPTPLSSAAARTELAALGAGDEGTLSGVGSRTVVVTLKRASSLIFGCVGSGPLRLGYSVPGGEFRARCLPSSPTNFTTNVALSRYPGRLRIRVQVGPESLWRLVIDSHVIEFVNP